MSAVSFKQKFSKHNNFLREIDFHTNLLEHVENDLLLSVYDIALDVSRLLFTA